MVEGVSLTLRVCRDVERDDRNVYDSDIGCPVYLHPVCLQITVVKWCQKNSPSVYCPQLPRPLEEASNKIRLYLEGRINQFFRDNMLGDVRKLVLTCCLTKPEWCNQYTEGFV